MDEKKCDVVLLIIPFFHLSYDDIHEDGYEDEVW